MEEVGRSTGLKAEESLIWDGWSLDWKGDGRDACVCVFVCLRNGDVVSHQPVWCVSDSFVTSRAQGYMLNQGDLQSFKVEGDNRRAPSFICFVVFGNGTWIWMLKLTAFIELICLVWFIPIVNSIQLQTSGPSEINPAWLCKGLTSVHGEELCGN